MSWDQLTAPDSLGTSPFQNLCCRALRKFLPDLEFLEEGDARKYFSTRIAKTDIKILIHADRVDLSTPNGTILLDRTNCAEPEDLIMRLITELSNAI